MPATIAQDPGPAGMGRAAGPPACAGRQARLKPAQTAGATRAASGQTASAQPRTRAPGGIVGGAWFSVSMASPAAAL